MRRITLPSVACLALKYIFFHILQTPDFDKHKMCVLILSIILSETLLIQRRTERDMIINEHWFSCKVPVTGVLNETLIFSKDLRKIIKYKIL